MKLNRLLALTAALLISGTAVAKEKIKLIAHGGTGNPFWAVVFKGAEQAAKDMDVDLQILFPNRDGDQPGTTRILSEALSTKPDGIAVTLGTSAHCEYIQEAQQKNIPVVVFNVRADEQSKKCPYGAYVGMDEYEAGRASASRGLASGKVKGRAMIGLTEAGHAGLQQRARGIKEVLKEAGVEVDIVDIGNDPAAVPARIKGYVAKNKKDLSALFIPAVNGIHPVIRMARQDPEGIGQLYMATFDLTPLILDGIQKGTVEHTIDQQPYLQGYYSVAQLVLASRGAFTPMDMNTGMAFVDQDNATRVVALVQDRIR